MHHWHSAAQEEMCDANVFNNSSSMTNKQETEWKTNRGKKTGQKCSVFYLKTINSHQSK